MPTAIAIIVGIIVLVGVLVSWRYHATCEASARVTSEVESLIEPVIGPLKTGTEPGGEAIAKAAGNVVCRSALYRTLAQMERLDLFPKDQSALHLIAASDLAKWLMHPNELGSVPDEIELVQDVRRTEGEPPEEYAFFVLKFREVKPDSPANDWLVGVAGPYWNLEPGEYTPPGVFSILEKLDACTPEEHLAKAEKLLLNVLNRG